MGRIDESFLLDLALGLRDDPELWQTVEGSKELRREFRRVKREVEDLDRELQTLAGSAEDATRTLKQGRWRVLAAVDGSPECRRVTAAAAALAQASAGTVTVLHVREVDPVPGCASAETRAEAERLVSELVDGVREEGVQAQGAVCTDWRGRAARDIAAAALRMGADLVVVGACRSSWLASLVTGSVARDALRLAPCPVLIVH